MRRLRYELLPPIGPGTMPVEGTVVELLFDIPYLIGWSAPFPSHDQLNSLLRKGYRDAGMSGGCEWAPFELSADEYDEVVSAIKRDERLQQCPTPNLEGSAEWASLARQGYWIWDMDRGEWVSNEEVAGKPGDLDDIPF